MSANVTADGGGNITARGVVFGLNANPTLTDTKTSDGTGTGNFTAALSNLSPSTSYHLRAYATNSAGTAFSGDVTFRTLDADAKPTITSGPASAVVIEGGHATFHIVATGNPTPTFQWQTLRGAGTWTNVDGATADTYTTDALVAADDGLKVRVLATNKVGDAASDPATIQVHWAPTISLHPAETTVLPGAQATFQVSGTANPIPSCQWQRSLDSGATWTDVPGATTSTLEFTPELDEDGALFRAILVNGVGTATSQPARLGLRNLDGTPVLSAAELNAKTVELQLTIPTWSGVQVQGITAAQFNANRPNDALPFDIGFIAADGSVSISEPVTSVQRIAFRNAQQGAAFYMAQAMMRQWYGVTKLPLWLGTGFGGFKAGLRPNTDRIRSEVATLGRKPTLAELEDPSFYNAHQGLDFSLTFGEWICVFYDSGVLRWDLRVQTDGSQTFNIGQNVRTRDDMTRVWHMLVDGFHLDTSSARIRLQERSKQVDYYYADKDANYIPNLRQILETTLTDYSATLGVAPKARFTFLLQPTREMHSEWAGWTFDPNGWSIGGGGLTGFRMVSPAAAQQSDGGVHLMRHEFAHTMQMQVLPEFMPAWLSEGFPDAIQNSPYSGAAIAERKPQAQTAMSKATTFYGHRPTLSEMGYYSNLTTEYNYYDLAGPMTDFVVRTWGWDGVKKLILNRAQDVTVLSVKDAEEFMTLFYAFYDQTWAQ